MYKFTKQGSLERPLCHSSHDDYLRGEEFVRLHPPPSNTEKFDLSNISFVPNSHTMVDNDGNGNTIRFNDTYGADTSITTNGPVPRDYTYSVTIQDMTPHTCLAIGFSTSPYPPFRLPGWHHWSAAYHSDDGRLFVCDPNDGQAYGKPFRTGDTVTASIDGRNLAFKRNMTVLPSVLYTLDGNLGIFPIIGADGPCTVTVDLLHGSPLFEDTDTTDTAPPPYTFVDNLQAHKRI